MLRKFEVKKKNSSTKILVISKVHFLVDFGIPYSLEEY